MEQLRRSIDFFNLNQLDPWFLTLLRIVLIAVMAWMALGLTQPRSWIRTCA